MTARSYRTKLSLPLVGLPPEAVLEEVLSALEADGRVEQQRPVPVCAADDELVEHVWLSIRFSAPTEAEAKATVADLHDTALRAIMAALPPTAQVGWTSGCGHPEPV